MFNYRSRSINQCGVVGSSSIQNPYTALGLLGTNQIGAIADTGLDVNSCYFSDPNTKVIFSPITSPIYTNSARKIIQYAYVSNYGDMSDDIDGHGTHVTGTMVGSVTTDAADYAKSKYIRATYHSILFETNFHLFIYLFGSEFLFYSTTIIKSE